MLTEACAQPPASTLERDGVIQRFAYTFELSWKAMRKHLMWLGRSDVSGSPKPIIRDAYEEGLIQSVDDWFAYVEARNSTVHVYHELRAAEVFAVAQRFVSVATALLTKLEQA